MAAILVGTDRIKKQAVLIRDIAQKVIDACDQWPQPIDSFARNKIMSGSLAQEAAMLAIMILQAEFIPEEESEE